LALLIDVEEDEDGDTYEDGEREKERNCCAS